MGALLIDLAPPWAKDTAIARFGTADKIALITGIATSEFPTLAKRPAYSMLDSSALEQHFGIPPSDWRQGVRQTLLALQTERAQAGSLVS